MIVGILNWYAENPNWLSSAIAAIAPAIDHLVAVDGAYALFPGALQHPCSPLEQVEAVTETAHAVNLPLTLHQRHEPWYENEVEKRNYSLKLAETLTTEDDWYLIFDADLLADHISSAFKDVVANVGSDFIVGEYGYWADGQDNQKTRCLYRAIRGLEYGPAHWTLSAEIDRERVWLWGSPRVHQPMAEPYDFSTFLKFEHRSRNRDDARSLGARTYYALRDKLGVESVSRMHMPGLDGQIIPVARV